MKYKKEIFKKTVFSSNTIPFAYLFISILLTIPSIFYLINNKTIYYFTQVYSYTLRKATTIGENYLNALMYLMLFFGLFFFYFLIMKNVNRIFKTKKQLFFFLIVIGILFTTMIPTTSLDVYSYIGNGWIDSHYKENPYYTSVQDVINQYGKNQMLGKVAQCWRDEPVVYGPAWQLVCKILTFFSFGDITLALYLFKITAFGVFLASSVLIEKITKKKFFVVLFALNPFILFEFLANVHNDIFLVFFLFLGIYFAKNKKNMVLATASIAVATGMKYLSILLLPFLICYALREEKLQKKVKKTIFYAFEFIFILGIFYVFYVRDLQVFSGIFIQQNKYERSLFLFLFYFLNQDEKVLHVLKIFVLCIFVLAYGSILLKLFRNKQGKKITFRNTIRTYQSFLLLFTFVLITNFNAWYVIWLFPTLMWQKAKAIKTSLYLSWGVLNSYAITYATRIEGRKIGMWYFGVMLLTVLILCIVQKIQKARKKSLRNGGKI